MSTLSTILLVGILFIAIASLIALVYAVAHAEDGYEDETGFHRTVQDNQGANTTSATVDTGNPWDQIEGAACPIELNHPMAQNPIHQP